MIKIIKLTSIGITYQTFHFQGMGHLKLDCVPLLIQS